MNKLYKYTHLWKLNLLRDIKNCKIKKSYRFIFLKKIVYRCVYTFVSGKTLSITSVLFFFLFNKKEINFFKKCQRVNDLVMISTRTYLTPLS